MKNEIQRDRKSSTKTEILNLFEIRKSALSHKDFQEYFEKKIDRVTIYRALERLTLEGKLHKIVNFDGVTQYALCTECKKNENNKRHNHEHVHFFCTKCKITTCLENTFPKIEIPSGYDILETQILMNGICKNCKKD